MNRRLGEGEKWEINKSWIPGIGDRINNPNFAIIIKNKLTLIF
jgi:hypothetical protein